VNYQGELPHHELEQQLLAHHAFVLPTKGENFGHAIFEALAAGRPALISDQTPWRNLAMHQAGWDLPLSQPATFAAAIEQTAAMNGEQLNDWCTGAWNFCRQYIESSGIKEQYIKLFS
jgi:glycosyltransferase involved in cell wall biosynthesis